MKNEWGKNSHRGGVKNGGHENSEIWHNEIEKKGCVMGT